MPVEAVVAETTALPAGMEVARELKAAVTFAFG